jgi:prepilin-type N-terminal cleavage/methylation domain-containing protein
MAHTVEIEKHGLSPDQALEEKPSNMNRIRKTKGFTLVEIMIVVLIIGILMAIAVPNFLKARQSSRQKTVIANLRQVDSAKEQWAMETGQISGAACVEGNLYPVYMKNYPLNTPVTGVYVPNAVGADPDFLGKTAAQWAADPTGL